MIVTEHFVFLHVPKTGGLFVTDIIRRHFDYIEVGHIHAGYEQIPPEYRHLPALAFVRNPWDWYVSVYSYMMRAQGPNSPARQAAEKGFVQFIEFCTQRQHMGRGFSATFANSTTGAQIGRFEHLRADLFTLLDEVMNPELGRDILELEPVNVSKRGPYEDYYDDYARDLVARECKDIVDRFGYVFRAAEGARHE
jgi:hypothetical protein